MGVNMNEDYIRNLPTEQLLNIRNKLLENENMTTAFEARVNSLEAAVSKLIAMAEEEEKKMPEKVEEKEELKAEEEEQEKKVPVTTVTAEEEEEKPEEEEEEEKLEALEDKVKQLASLLMKKRAYVADDGAITPETPEDEPQMRGKVKIPAVKSGRVDAGMPDVADPKRGKKIQVGETPSMKPGAKTMKVGASFSKKSEVAFDSNTKSLEEIFDFAASRGTTPMHAGMPMLRRI